jgi:hypothetical protein
MPTVFSNNNTWLQFTPSLRFSIHYCVGEWADDAVYCQRTAANPTSAGEPPNMSMMAQEAAPRPTQQAKKPPKEKKNFLIGMPQVAGPPANQKQQQQLSASTGDLLVGNRHPCSSIHSRRSHMHPITATSGTRTGRLPLPSSSSNHCVKCPRRSWT